MGAGLKAIPKGLGFLRRTRGVKRWLIPPFTLALVILVACLTWLSSTVKRAMDGALPDQVRLRGKELLADIPEKWDWVESAWLGLIAMAEWTLTAGAHLLTSAPLRWIGTFLIGSLFMWYCFSIAYEALAGPFLDEIQARVEKRWFGSDPRSRLERPNQLPASTCMRRSVVAGAIGALLSGIGIGALGFAWWTAGPLMALPLLISAGMNREYGQWLRWVARIEWRAAYTSIKASILVALIMVLALPLYFVPVVGYFLYAGVCGFGTAISLLDIPMERRGWSTSQRIRFVFRNLPAMTTFGATAGILLAIPILGPALMVPGASIGGLWLICRLEKPPLRGQSPTKTPSPSP